MSIIERIFKPRAQRNTTNIWRNMTEGELRSVYRDEVRNKLIYPNLYNRRRAHRVIRELNRRGVAL